MVVREGRILAQMRRFSESEYSTGELLNIVFYAAAPLITSTGHRIGTL